MVYALILREKVELGIVVHACNLNYGRWRQEDLKFEVSLHIVRCYLKKNTQTKKLGHGSSGRMLA
jgi:hypothetical protein